MPMIISHNLEDPTQQHTAYTNKVDASLFTTDTTTPCDYNISTDIQNSNKLQEIKLIPYNQWEYIPKVNINTEMFLVILTSNIMILIMLIIIIIIIIHLSYICGVAYHLGMCPRNYRCFPLLKTFVNCRCASDMPYDASEMTSYRT